MPGQPNIPGVLVFDVTNLQINEPPGAQAPSIVVPINNPFDLVVTFQGSGMAWLGFENGAIQYDCHFYAEGQGIAATDIDFGVQSGNLVPGQGTYTETLNVAAGIPNPGIYDITCRVIFPNVSGMTGFSPPITIEAY